MNRFDFIEKKLRELFESNPLILQGSGKNTALIHQLCQEMQSFLIQEGSAGKDIPCEFRISLNPEVVSVWKSLASWEEILKEALISAAIDSGYKFSASPEFTLFPDVSLSPTEVKIGYSGSTVNCGGTGMLSIESTDKTGSDRQSNQPKAFLILDEKKVFLLDKPVTNIGRKANNQLIVNNLKVSRNHAQIRKVQDDFVIFDIGSTGGTFINNKRIERHVLRPGDVISLAGYLMVYSEDQDMDEGVQKSKTSEIKIHTDEDHSS